MSIFKSFFFIVLCFQYFKFSLFQLFCCLNSWKSRYFCLEIIQGFIVWSRIFHHRFCKVWSTTTAASRLPGWNFSVILENIYDMEVYLKKKIEMKLKIRLKVAMFFVKAIVKFNFCESVCWWVLHLSRLAIYVHQNAPFKNCCISLLWKPSFQPSCSERGISLLCQLTHFLSFVIPIIIISLYKEIKQWDLLTYLFSILFYI